MAADAGYSLWLLPEAAAQSRLTALVAELAPRFGQPAFVPHVTVQGDLLLGLDTVSSHARAIADATPVQHWRIDAVESTGNFFRCLYLRFADSPAFDDLRRAAQTHSGTAVGLSPYPHLSLAYGQLTPDVAGLPAELSARFAGQTLTFDRLAVCRSSKDIPIDEWDCVLTLPLQTQP